MAKLGRNDPCPCGSQKKYKRCCLPKEQALEQTKWRADQQEAETRRQQHKERQAALKALRDQDQEELKFIESSNAVVDLIHAGRLDEAERAARVLIELYPGATDGLERLGHVHEARGDMKTAAGYYRQALELAKNNGLPEDEHLATLRHMADRIDPPL